MYFRSLLVLDNVVILDVSVYINYCGCLVTSLNFVNSECLVLTVAALELDEFLTLTST